MFVLNELIIKFEAIVWSTPLVLTLMLTHIYLTLRLKIPQKYILKGFKLMIKPDKSVDCGISSFKSLMTILAATLGTGNIVGVSTAICIGGIGSIFWIFISGVFAIATKYCETYIVLKYRKKDKSGKYFGGAMYVLRDRLGFKLLATLFCIFVILASFGIGSMIQSNSMTSTISTIFNTNKYIIAIAVTVFCTYIIFGNEKRISNMSAILVPIATIIYSFMCIWLLFLFKDNILSSISLIIKEALNFKALAGGAVGSIAIVAMNAGMSKGLFSNEAGMGSSPIFNSTVSNNNIKNESIIASSSVFIDTVIYCTITGIVLVASGLCSTTSNPIVLIQDVFKLVPFGKYLLVFSLSIFAISGIPCWGYYGNMAINYLFNTKVFYTVVYKLIYAICIFIGAVAQIQVVWSMSAIANALMVIPNLIMIYCLKKEVDK